jgi:hypothetical protein
LVSWLVVSEVSVSLLSGAAIVATIAETIRVDANQINVMRQSRPFCLYECALGLIMDLEPVRTGSEIFVQK